MLSPLVFLFPRLLFPCADSLIDRRLLGSTKVKVSQGIPPLSPDSRDPSMTGTGRGDEHYSRLVRELCALLFTIVSPAAGPGRPGTSPPGTGQAGGVSPAAVASMLLGASMALMLCGSVTFAIGLLLMPWVAGIALLFGFA